MKERPRPRSPRLLRPPPPVSLLSLPDPAAELVKEDAREEEFCSTAHSPEVLQPGHNDDRVCTKGWSVAVQDLQDAWSGSECWESATDAAGLRELSQHSVETVESGGFLKA
ncbi:hypothetical protein MRS44_014429 [Fusarium solani]|uniref:uncharacterized protein n=1 Tax=Fusarium solani TaxID=169388 RepID=UPI0032C3E652|nr:hypothetical protein MRS44_014429 [Fusarium solani]